MSAFLVHTISHHVFLNIVWKRLLLLRSQVTLDRRNGTSVRDYSALWWDELPVAEIVTSFVRLDILSKYSAPNLEDRRVFELEIYVGQGVKCKNRSFKLN